MTDLQVPRLDLCRTADFLDGLRRYAAMRATLRAETARSSIFVAK